MSRWVPRPFHRAIVTFGVCCGLTLQPAGAARASEPFAANYYGFLSPSPGFWGWNAKVVDLDGDGRGDLLSIRQTTTNIRTSLEVNRSTATGGVSPIPVVIPLGLVDDLGAYFEAEDLDGDGDIDLAVTGRDSVSIVPGTPGGGFGAPQLMRIPGVYDGGIGVGDLNGDGYEDLAVSVKFRDRVAIFWGGPGLLFTAGPELVAPSFTDVVEVADLDGDLDPDIVASGSTASTVFLNDGQGAFTPASLPVAVNGIADFDQDGHPDLFGSVGVQLGAGDGTFAPPLPIAIANPRVAGDLNEDGITDLVGLDATHLHFLVQRGLGHGAFQVPISHVSHSRAFTLNLGDVNSDGHFDLIEPTLDGAGTFVLYGAGDGVFTDAPSFDATIFGTVLASGDLNGDTTPDLVVAGRGVRSLSILRSTGPAAYAAPLVYPLNVGYAKVRTGDINGDGRADVLGATDSSNVVAVWLAQPDGSLSGGTSVALPSSVFEFQLADIDGDGDRDLVYQVAVAPFSGYAPGDGNGGFGTPTAFPFTIRTDIQVADLNGDGMVDLVGEQASHRPSICFATSPGVFGNVVDLPGPGFSMTALRVGHWDGDAIPDLLAVYGGLVQLYRGLGGRGVRGAGPGAHTAGSVQGLG